VKLFDALLEFDAALEWPLDDPFLDETAAVVPEAPVVVAAPDAVA